ncbi:aminoacyltransferase [Gleimia sp. 6138-11-ORH1]|uniref:lipid II:glycine glycyltransferase FemX n=1 Tax=Gleimia sp. 6138-11-ORH1 TaxID=2973937 RepID=UPI00216A950F|nr:aminoacyltransferase [Gleimia sp. 6138-11-ORH1]MCS4484182.1 aminoacyltransferase [Gleimia sp. 6138-11-ORH1]
MPVLSTPFADTAEIKAQLAAYEEFVATSEYGNYMQSIHWAELKNNWNADLVYLQSETGEITAAMTILSISNDGGETSFMYVPRGPVADFAEVDTVQALLAEAKPAIELRNPFLLRIEPAHQIDDQLVESYRALGYKFRSREIENIYHFTQMMYAVVLDLVGKDETAVTAHSARFRNELSKSYRSGIQTTFYGFTDPDFESSYDEFYELMNVTGSRQDFVFRPKPYYRRMLELYPQSRLVISRDEEGTALSAAVLVIYNRKMAYFAAASSNEKRNLYPNIQMNFEAIKYALELGLAEYDMGGVDALNPDECGMYKFKRKICGDNAGVHYIGSLDVVFDEAKYQDFLPKD